MREVSYHDGRAQLWVAETPLIGHRPAPKNVHGRRYEPAGRPLELRSIIVPLRDEWGVVLAAWMVLSQVPPAWATAAELAFCSAWRWRLESFFKLLKSRGQQLEPGQQETGPAVARRRLVAAMAGVTVWHRHAEQSTEARERKSLLVRLSGRQTKRRSPQTAPALLAGRWVLRSMRTLLEPCDLDRLTTLAAPIRYHSTAEVM